MAIAIVQSDLVTSSNGSGTTHDLPFPSTVTAGNTLLLFLYDDLDVSGVTVNGESGPPSATLDYSEALAVYTARVYRYPNATASATGFRITTSTSHFDAKGWVVELSGVATSTPFTDSGTFPDDFQPTEMDATVSVNAAGDAAFSVFTGITLANITSTRSGFTQSADSLDALYLLQYNLNTGSGTVTAGCTTSSSPSLVSGYAVSYKAAAGGGFTVTADSGTYALTGQAANTLYARIMPAAQGTYALTGVDALLVKSGSYSFNAEPGAYTLIGASALVDLSMNAAQGSYALTGQAATLTFTPFSNPSVTAEFGSYTLTGRDANTNYGRIMPAEVGVYALTGRQAGLIWSGAPVSTGYSSQKMTFSALTISL